MISSVVKGINGTRFRRAGRGYLDLLSILGFISITSLDLMVFFQETIYLEQKMEQM